MGKVITVHSFRRSAGRSSLVANLGVLMAEEGRKVAQACTSYYNYPKISYGIPLTITCGGIVGFKR
jgi:hypothetical protein